MGNKSNIEWTDATWNPTYGCSMAPGSERGGCLHCYAAALHARGLPGLVQITGKPLAKRLPTGVRWTGDVGLNEKALYLPLHWKKPRRIFVNSMSDLFHEALTDEQIDRVFAVMALCPQHIFQVLTKRADRMLAWALSKRGHLSCEFQQNPARSASVFMPLDNCWLGVSVENQTTADARIAALLRTPAAIRFVSYEPALGPVDFTRFLHQPHWEVQESSEKFRHREDCPCSGTGFMPPPINQIIVGGESGPGARPFDVAWARQTIEQCKAAAVACFVKQFGARPHYPARPDCAPVEMALFDRRGGDMAEWPSELRVREFPA